MRSRRSTPRDVWAATPPSRSGSHHSERNRRASSAGSSPNVVAVTNATTCGARAIIAAVSTDDELRQSLAELASVIDTLLTIRVQKGELNEGHLRVIQKLKRHAKAATAPQIALDHTTDKYEVEGTGADIDCAARMHLCLGRCCSFQIPLSAQDLREGKLEWQID